MPLARPVQILAAPGERTLACPSTGSGYQGPVDRPLARIAVLCVALGAGCATTSASPPQPGAPKLRHLTIEGTRAVPTGEIRSRISTSATPSIPFSAPRYFDPSILDSDLKRVLRLYQARGYYHAQIAYVRVAPAGEGAVDVTISVVEGEPTRVVELAIEGAEALPPDVRAALFAKLPLQQGDVFTEKAYDALKYELGERLRNAGYAEAEVNGVVQVDVPRDAATVALGLTPGERYRFGEILVAGAARVPRATIVRAAVRAVQPGSLYSDTALDAAQARVFDLGVFTTVRVSRGAPDRATGTVPVIISVREAPFHTLRLGGGFALDPTRQEIPRGTAEWSSRDFFGGLRRLTFANALALVFVPNLFQGLKSSENRGIAGLSSLTFQQPEFLARDLDLTSTVAVERGVDLGFKYNEARASAGVIVRLSRRVTLVPSYNFQVFKLTGLVTSAVFNPSTSLATQEAALDACSQQGRICRLAFLEQRLTWDLRDNAAQPRRGGWLSLALQEGSPVFGGIYRYLRLAPEVRGYFPLGPHTLAARALGGFLLPARGEVSSVLTRFYLGGTVTERGFGNRQLSPSVVVNCTTQSACGGFTQERIPVGGNGMLGASVEFRASITASLGFTLFFDLGEVQPTVGELSLSAMNYAAGIGVRYQTMFGPIRFDFGYRLNNPPLSIVPINNDVSLKPSCGTRDSYSCIDRFALHFSIGEAF